VLETGDALADQVETLEANWNDYDFFYLSWLSTIPKSPTLWARPFGSSAGEPTGRRSTS